MKRLTTLALSAVLICVEASAVDNPHDPELPERCLYCHEERIAFDLCNDNDSYCLLKPTIDEVCLSCHRMEECCPIGMEGQPALFIGHSSHPTDLLIKHMSFARLPQTLPTPLGKLSCRTCHLHDHAQLRDYAMLRLVEYPEGQPDWTVLCRDCHEEY